MTENPRFDLSSRSIIVGTDGSDDSRLAVRWAAELAEATGVELLVVHSLALMEQLPSGDRVPSDQVRDDVHTRLETEWCAPAQDYDISVRPILEDGPPVLVLPRVAEREGASMIIVGTRGRGRAPVDMIGSTCHGLINSSAIPVVTLRP